MCVSSHQFERECLLYVFDKQIKSPVCCTFVPRWIRKLESDERSERGGQCKRRKTVSSNKIYCIRHSGRQPASYFLLHRSSQLAYTENCKAKKLRSSTSMSLDMLIAKDLLESLQTSWLLWYEHTDCFLKNRNNQCNNGIYQLIILLLGTNWEQKPAMAVCDK